MSAALTLSAAEALAFCRDVLAQCPEAQTVLVGLLEGRMVAGPLYRASSRYYRNGTHHSNVAEAYRTTGGGWHWNVNVPEAEDGGADGDVATLEEVERATREALEACGYVVLPTPPERVAEWERLERSVRGTNDRADALRYAVEGIRVEEGRVVNTTRYSAPLDAQRSPRLQVESTAGSVGARPALDWAALNRAIGRLRPAPQRTPAGPARLLNVANRGYWVMDDNSGGSGRCRHRVQVGERNEVQPPRWEQCDHPMYDVLVRSEPRTTIRLSLPCADGVVFVAPGAPLGAVRAVLESWHRNPELLRGEALSEQPPHPEAQS